MGRRRGRYIGRETISDAEARGPLPLVTVRTQSCVKLTHLQSAPECVYIYIYIYSVRCGGGGGGGGRRIHYFASGTKSRDGKRSFILSLYSFYFLPTKRPYFLSPFFVFSFFSPFPPRPGIKRSFLFIGRQYNLRYPLPQHPSANIYTRFLLPPKTGLLFDWPTITDFFLFLSFCNVALLPHETPN